MAEVIHITENANQPEARVSALSLSELGILIGNNLPTADPLTVGALWNDGGVVKASPTPLVISDFKNGVYSIGGVSKTYADLWKPIPTHLALTAGVGIEIVDAAPTTSAFAATVTGQAALLSAADPQIGCTGVLSVETTLVEPTTDSLDLMLQLFASGTFDPFIEASVSPTSDVGNSGSFIGSGNPFLQSSYPSTASGTHKIVFSYSPTVLKMSQDGGDILTVAIPAGFNTIDLYNLYFTWKGTITGSLKSVSFYPLITDDTLLKTLST